METAAAEQHEACMAEVIEFTQDNYDILGPT